MLNCREVVRQFSGGDFERTGWSRKFSLWLHLALCRHCRRYLRQIRAIGRTAHELWNLTPEENTVLTALTARVALLFKHSRAAKSDS